MFRRVKKFGLLLATVALLVLAAAYMKQVQANANFRVLSPQEGGHEQSPVSLRLEIEGATIGSPFLGRDHLHLSINGGPEQAVYSYERGDELNISLPPGEHRIWIELAGPTHRALLPAKEVTFVVD